MNLLKDEGTKNPIYVHKVRKTVPGYHNRSHRKAIRIAWSKAMLEHITNIDPWESPWMISCPKVTVRGAIFGWLHDKLC